MLGSPTATVFKSKVVCLKTCLNLKIGFETITFQPTNTSLVMPRKCLINLYKNEKSNSAIHKRKVIISYKNKNKVQLKRISFWGVWH